MAAAPSLELPAWLPKAFRYFSKQNLWNTHTYTHTVDLSSGLPVEKSRPDL